MIIIILIIFIEYVGFATIGLLPNLAQKSLRQPPSQLVSNRAHKYYQVNFASEVGGLQKTKVIYSIYRARLTNLEIGKLTIEKWEQDHTNVEFLPTIEESLCIIRSV